MLRFIAAATLVLTGGNVAEAADDPVSVVRKATALELASYRLIPLMKGETQPEEYFTDSFLTAVPPIQFKALTSQLIKEHGQPVGIVETQRQTENIGTFKLEFENAFAVVNITADPKSRKVSGLFLSGIEKRGDSAAKIKADFAALPGSAGYIVARLSDNKAPELVAGSDTQKQFAIASTFKLYILAELADQVKAGKQKWSDVTPLSHRSFSSQATRNWPEDSPATLETLALQMIGVSDNSATDTLLHHLGRRNVGNKLVSTGHSKPYGTLPMLATAEAFAMKGNSEARTAFLNATETGQREMLSREAEQLTYDAISPDVFSSPSPKHIDTIEWFASPTDIAKLLNNIRQSRNDRMLKIMSVNAGPAESRRPDWNYIGYKGGSEPGVISMSFLGQAKDGKWYAITGSWNDPKKPVDDDKFSSLMTRLLDSVFRFCGVDYLASYN